MEKKLHRKPTEQQQAKVLYIAEQKNVKLYQLEYNSTFFY